MFMSKPKGMESFMNNDFFNPLLINVYLVDINGIPGYGVIPLVLGVDTSVSTVTFFF